MTRRDWLHARAGSYARDARALAEQGGVDHADIWAQAYQQIADELRRCAEEQT